MGRLMIEHDFGVEHQLVGFAGKVRDRDAIAKCIVQPSHILGPRKDVKPELNQVLIEAVARPAHQAVVAQAHRSLVGVTCDVADGQERHERSSRTERLMGTLATASV